MNAGLVSAILGAVVRSLPDDLVKNGIGKFVDHIESEIAKSDNKWDDTLLPLLDALKKQIGYVTPPTPA